MEEGRVDTAMVEWDLSIAVFEIVVFQCFVFYIQIMYKGNKNQTAQHQSNRTRKVI